MTEQAKLTFEWKSGALRRKRDRFDIEVLCKRFTERYEIIEHRGWLSSSYFVEAWGDGEKLKQLWAIIEAEIRRINEETTSGEQRGDGDAIAVHVRDLPTSSSGATQKLWRVGSDHVVTSAVYALYSGPETYVFPGDAEGNVTDYGELDGSFRGGLDHGQAIDGYLESLSEASS